MDLLTILLTAVGLSMDCMAVAVAIGVQLKRVRAGDATKIAVSFGGFQTMMPIIGWAVGTGLSDIISGIDHWIAFILLGFIGGRMIYEAYSEGDEGPEGDPLILRKLLILSIATSIDALAVGISLALLNTSIVVAATVIGLVAFSLSFLGAYASSSLRKLLGSKAKVIGGVILIGIAFRILLEHIA